MSPRQDETSDLKPKHKHMQNWSSKQYFRDVAQTGQKNSTCDNIITVGKC